VSGTQIVFYLLASLVILGAIGVITRKNAVHSAILLIGTLMGVAGIYVVLEAEFLAAVQVLVYAGGVMVLFLFVIMLVDLEQRGRPESERRKISKRAVVSGAILTLILMCVLLSTFMEKSLGPPPSDASVLHAEGGNLGAVGMAMFTYYLLPFEMASVLLLVAMIGAILLARLKI
jgi:NADH-quinone oxidoreductase subunit J